MRSDATENDRNEPAKRRRADVIAALEEVWSREKARLITTIPPEAAKKLNEFLMEKDCQKGRAWRRLFSTVYQKKARRNWRS